MKSFVGLLALVAVASASPMLSGGAFSNSFWKGTRVEGVIKNLQTDCNDRGDGLSCMKFKLLHFLDQVLNQESVQVNENLEIVQNGEGSQRVSKSEKTDMDLLDHLENYIKSHDVIAKLPGTTLTLSPRNLDKDEMTLQMKFSGDEREGKAVQGEEGRKSKLKKIIIPVLVFVLLKAMTLIPLAIGVLGLKAWNALQLSFFSFVVSLALAIFQLCKKLASDHTSAQVAAHGPWDNYQAAHYAARAFPQEVVEDGQDIAYNAYSKS